MLTTVEDEIKTAVVVADASTKAMLRSMLVGTIPIIEFGAIGRLQHDYCCSTTRTYQEDQKWLTV